MRAALSIHDESEFDGESLPVVEERKQSIANSGSNWSMASGSDITISTKKKVKAYGRGRGRDGHSEE